MSVTVRPYRRGGWEVDLRVTLPDESVHRLRLRAPLGSKSAAQRWGEERERHWYHKLTHPQLVKEQKDVPTLRQFAPRFVDGHARANRQKPSGIAAKEMILRVHLVPALGHKKLDAIKNEDVQRLKRNLEAKSPRFSGPAARLSTRWSSVNNCPASCDWAAVCSCDGTI